MTVFGQPDDHYLPTNMFSYARYLAIYVYGGKSPDKLLFSITHLDITVNSVADSLSKWLMVIYTMIRWQKVL